jgi:hypothetical protein
VATVYENIYNLHANSNLRNRVTVAIAKASQDILAEADTVANHTERLTWAKTVMHDPAEEAAKMMWGVLGSTTIRTKGENATDAEVQAAVDAILNVFAVGV